MKMVKIMNFSKFSIWIIRFLSQIPNHKAFFHAVYLIVLNVLFQILNAVKILFGFFAVFHPNHLLFYFYSSKLGIKASKLLVCPCCQLLDLLQKQIFNEFIC